jgi:hypothetical protein
MELNLRATTSRLRLGFGFRLCVVLSVGVIGILVWGYESDLERWREYERCQQVMNAPPPPVGFSILGTASARSAIAGLEQDYRICPRTPPFSTDEPLPEGCAAVFTTSPALTTPVTIRGPAGATRKGIETAAMRLGLDGELSQLFATPQPVFADAAAKAAYDSCVARVPQHAPEHPALPSSAVLTALGWIWGAYVVVRFLLGR